MSKVIEADFPPRNPEVGSSWFSFMGRPSLNGARRILVVDNDFNTTRLIKILTRRQLTILYLRKTIRPRRIRPRAIFGPT